jgi:hypothetical protein
VKEQLLRRGAGMVDEQTVHQRRILRVTNPTRTDDVLVYARIRRTGDWQGSVRDADFDPSPGREFYWVLVDLTEDRRPAFYIAPGSWMQADVEGAHQEYLDRHGGKRAESPDSKHHAIRPECIERWKGRWDIIPVLPG